MSPVPSSASLPAGSFGPLFLFINVLLQRAGLPIPAAPALLLAGALAAYDPLRCAEFLLLAVLACACGDLLWFFAGSRYGAKVLRWLCRISLSPDACIDTAKRRFQRFGPAALLIAKFIPGLAAISPPLAGTLRMSVARFLILSALGSTLWAAAWLGVGALASPQLIGLLPWLLHRAAQAASITALLLGIYVLGRWWRRHRLLA